MRAPDAAERSPWARVRAHLAGRGEWWWAALVYALAVAWIYRGLWHEWNTPTGLGWDTNDSYGPDLQFLSSDYAQGRFSLWSPYDHGGYSLVADIGFPRWYPVHWLFAAWGALTGPSWWTIQIEMLAHHALAGATMHLYLRTRGLGRGPALVGGLSVIASGAFLVHKASILLWPIAWAPLVLVAIDRAAARPDARRGAQLGAAIALVGVAGSPPSFLYVLMLAGPYGALRFGGALVDARRRGELGACARAIGVALGAGAALTIAALAVLVVPLAELLPLAQRGDMKGADFALNAPLPWSAIWGMLAPTHGNMSASIGATGLALAACALALRPRFDRGVAILFWAVGAFGFVLTLGEPARVLPWMIRHVPGFELFRAPARYRLITTLALAACAGHGAQALLDAPRAWGGARLRGLAIAVATVALAALVVAVAARSPMPPHGRGGAWSIALAAAAAAAIAALLLAPAWARALIFAAMAVVVVDDAPFFLHPPLSPPAAEPRRVHDAGQDEQVLARLGDVAVAYRLYDEFVIGDRVGPRHRVRDFRGYAAIDPLSQKRYLDVLQRAKKQPEILEAYNVRWILHQGHFRDGLTACFVGAAPPAAHFVDRGDGIFEARHPAPLAAWYASVRIADKPGAVLDLVLAADPAPTPPAPTPPTPTPPTPTPTPTPPTPGPATIGPPAAPPPAAPPPTAPAPRGRAYATLEPPDAALLPAGAPAQLAAAASASVDARVVDYQPDAIDLEVDAPAAGVVVLDEVAYPGWEVRVDGDAATPLRADYLLRAVYVTAGHHAIAWRFHPTHFRLLFALHALAWLALAASLAPASWLAALRRRRRHPAAA